MNNFYKKPGLLYTYINIFYNICIGTVGKLCALIIIKTVNPNDLCRTLTIGVQTALASIANRAVLYILHRKSLSAACISQAIQQQRFHLQFWPGSITDSSGIRRYLVYSRVSSRLSLYPLYACKNDKVSGLSCYIYV